MYEFLKNYVRTEFSSGSDIAGGWEFASGLGFAAGFENVQGEARYPLQVIWQ